MAVVKFLVEESGVTVTLDSISATASFMVSELTSDPWNREWEAINHADIPKPKDSHPSIPFVVVSNVTAKHVDTTTVKVIVQYERKASSGGGGNSQEPPGTTAVLTGGSTLQAVPTQIDALGNDITVKYTYADGNVDEQFGEVETQIPMRTRHYERVELTEPLAALRDFMGRINSVAIWDLETHCWLCSGISYSQQDGGKTWLVSYDFQGNEEGFDATVAYRNDEGKIPVDADWRQEDHGFKRNIQVYPDADFGELGLD